ncbi:hypothetical protein HK104_000748 [Borealophlyctis nickersoniae]|nr:hypothetical protein HK104_000748 [Borealophlyctis nickersoniae]
MNIATLPTVHYAYIICGATDPHADAWMYRDVARIYWFLRDKGFPASQIRTLAACSMRDITAAINEPVMYDGGRGALWDEGRGYTFPEDVVDVENLLDIVVETLDGSGSLAFQPKDNDITLMFFLGHETTDGGMDVGGRTLEAGALCDLISKMERTCRVGAYLSTCFSVAALPSTPTAGYVSAGAKPETGSLTSSSSGHFYRGAFMNAAITELENDLNVLIPEHLANIKNAGVDVQEGAFVCSNAVAALNIETFFRTFDKSSAAANSTPSASTNSTPPANMHSTSKRQRQRQAALARITETGPQAYLESLSFPMAINLPEIPWSYVGPIKRVAPPDMLLHNGLAGKSHRPDSPTPTQIIQDRHAMIVAWLEIMGMMWRRGLIVAERIREIVEGIRDITNPEFDSVREGIELMGENFPELHSDATSRDFSLYVVLGLVFLKEDWIGDDILKDILEERRWLVDRWG